MMTARRTYAIYTVLKIYMSALLSQLSSGAASSDTSSASASTGSTASKSSRPVHINRNVPKEKTPRKALSKMSKAQIRRFRAPALQRTQRLIGWGGVRFRGDLESVIVR